MAPDLIGFGRSAKGGHLDYTLSALATFLERLLAALDVQQVAIVGHQWGAAAGLVFAQRHPERVRRLAVCDPLPLIGGFRWPRLARAFRTPVVGELMMGATPRWLFGRTLRAADAGQGAFPAGRVRSIWEQFDQGTQRAILRLHRSTPEQELVDAGRRLESLRMPALVLWGEHDPWLPADFASAYGERLPQATIQRVPDAGHWPWLERPETADTIADFVSR